MSTQNSNCFGCCNHQPGYIGYGYCKLGEEVYNTKRGGSGCKFRNVRIKKTKCKKQQPPRDL